MIESLLGTRLLDSWHFLPAWLLDIIIFPYPLCINGHYMQLFEEDCASDKEQAALNFHEPSDLWKLPNTELYNRIAW